MSLRAFFEPSSIALIGASADPLSISARPLRMLVQHGFPRERLYPVNPKYEELYGLRVFPSISEVPEQVDLALIAVPAPVVSRVLRECAEHGTRYAVVLSSGFAETGARGSQLQAEIEQVVKDSDLRVNGPNAEGFYAAASSVCATFSPAVDPDQGFTPSEAGPIAVVSQSGGLGFALLNQGREMGLGFNAVVSTGNEVDLTFLDYVDHLLDQPGVKVVLGFVEGLRDQHRLADTANKAAALGKPIILAKMGRTDAARRAAAFHTGSDVGNDREYDHQFQELGIIRVDDVDEMLDLAAYFSVGRIPRGPSLAVLTTSGGAGAWLADACATRGLQLPDVEQGIKDEIWSFIPSYGSCENPVDITAQAVFSGGFERALGLLTQSPSFDSVVGVGSMVREDRFMSSLPELREVVEATDKPIVFYAYTRPGRAVVSALAELGVPCYSTPVRAARALAAAVGYRAFLDRHAIKEEAVR